MDGYNVMLAGNVCLYELKLSLVKIHFILFSIMAIDLSFPTLFNVNINTLSIYGYYHVIIFSGITQKVPVSSCNANFRVIIINC